MWCFLSEALVHISENFPPPWKWLLEYFISRLSFRTQVDIHVSSHQSFIHKTLCSAEQFRDNMGNQKSKSLWPICIFHSNIWSVLFKSHLLILLWELSENFISFLSLWLYYFKTFKLNEMVALYKVRGGHHWWLHIYPFSSLCQNWLFFPTSKCFAIQKSNCTPHSIYVTILNLRVGQPGNIQPY